MTTDPFWRLGQFLSAAEARRLADMFAQGAPLKKALDEIHSSRRVQVKAALADAGLGNQDGETSARVLRAIAGARSVQTLIAPVWTMPGVQASIGHLTSEARKVVDTAQISVTCSTYNFEETSGLWDALARATDERGVTVTAYVDGTAGQPATVAAHLRRATVMASRPLAAGCAPPRNHAKFVIIDHRVVLLGSANFSYSAEHLNIELGLRVESAPLAESIEKQMRNQHGVLYERVSP